MSSLTSRKQRTNSVPVAARRATSWPLALICAAQFGRDRAGRPADLLHRLAGHIPGEPADHRRAGRGAAPAAPARRRPGPHRLDLAGALVTLSVTSLIYGLSEGEDHGFTTLQAVAALALAVLLGCPFVLVERRAAAPMLLFGIFADPARRARWPRCS
jgi:hypothetical protein